MSQFQRFNAAAAALGQNLWVSGPADGMYRFVWESSDRTLRTIHNLRVEPAVVLDESAVMDRLVLPLLSDDVLDLLARATMMLEHSLERGSACVEMLGGPHDGELLEVQSYKDGFPPKCITLIVAPAIRWANPGEELAFGRIVYERRNLVIERGAWVYSLSGTFGV